MILVVLVLSIFTGIVLVLTIFTSTTAAATDKVICYYKSWSDSTFPPDSIDLDICTHVNFAFLRLNDDGSFRFDTYGGNETVLQKFADLKSKNPNVKLLITVGGWFEDSIAFSHVAADDHKKSTLASTLLYYMQTYGLDGIDIDWLYPGQNGGVPEDKENLIDLLSVVRRNLDNNGGGIIVLCAHYFPDPDIYNVTEISQLVDAINVLTYDFHGFESDTQTGANTPLYPSSTDSTLDKTVRNCDAAIQNWIEAGADPNKLILGLGFYGHNFTLVDPDQHDVGSPADGANEDYTAYNEICQLTDGWNEDFDDERKIPYKYSDNIWISYDNAESIALKVLYAKSQNLGGVMMWSVNDDDSEGLCGNKNPLLQAIKDNLSN